MFSGRCRKRAATVSVLTPCRFSPFLTCKMKIRCVLPCESSSFIEVLPGSIVHYGLGQMAGHSKAHSHNERNAVLYMPENGGNCSCTYSKSILTLKMNIPCVFACESPSLMGVLLVPIVHYSLGLMVDMTKVHKYSESGVDEGVPGNGRHLWLAIALHQSYLCG